MAKAILGRKVGMTRLYDAKGTSVPVTVVQAGPCFVSQVKTAGTDGYEAIQLAFEDIDPRNSTFPVIAHDAKAGLAPKRVHREVRLEEGEAAGYALGQAINVEVLDGVKFVDVVGTSKGKGFAGVMKKYHFGGLESSHGTERKHRSRGSISGMSSNRGTGKNKKGIRMAGRMGGERVTVRSLPVFGIDKDNGLLLIQGPIPGANKGLVYVREATRLWKRKAKLV